MGVQKTLGELGYNTIPNVEDGGKIDSMLLAWPFSMLLAAEIGQGKYSTYNSLKTNDYLKK